MSYRHKWNMWNSLKRPKLTKIYWGANTNKMFGPMYLKTNSKYNFSIITFLKWYVWGTMHVSPRTAKNAKEWPQSSYHLCFLICFVLNFIIKHFFLHSSFSPTFDVESPIYNDHLIYSCLMLYYFCIKFVLLSMSTGQWMGY